MKYLNEEKEKGKTEPNEHHVGPRDRPLRSRKNMPLGQLEQIILYAILHCPRRRAYGSQIRSEVVRRIDREVSIGALYSTLERLEKKGFISATVEAGPSSDGRKRRYYKVTTGLGIEGLKESRNVMEKMWGDIELDSVVAA